MIDDKTHDFKLGSTVKEELILIVTNLHILTSDQKANFASTNQDYGTVEAHNMDKLFLKSRGNTSSSYRVQII